MKKYDVENASTENARTSSTRSNASTVETPDAPTPNAPTPDAPAGALYRAVWRWHFYTGLVLSPLIVLLAITGAIYLWKPQFEAWRYDALLRVSPPTSLKTTSQNSTSQNSVAPKTLSPDAQLAAAQNFLPRAQAESYLAPTALDRSAEIVFKNQGDKTSVFVDPYTARVLGERTENTRLMTVVHDLHGELLVGKPGALLMELAGTWVFVMVLTGFYLNWPRPKFALRGFVIPRLRSGRHVLKRDLHVVPAVWMSGLLLVILATGMPWTTVSGQWLDIYSNALGQGRPAESSASAHRSEVLGGWSPYVKNDAIKRQLKNVASVAPTAAPPKSRPESLAHDNHVGHGKEVIAEEKTSRNALSQRISLSQVMAIAATKNLQSSYTIALPKGETGVYSILTDRNKPFVRAFIHMDQYSGRVLADVRYNDLGTLAKPVMWGIILHEGQLFGVPNQILGLITCLAVLATVFSGYALWWSRRPRRETAFGAPPRPSQRAFPRSVVWGTVVLGVFLPLLGATLIVLLLFDKLFTPRLKKLAAT